MAPRQLLYQGTQHGNSDFDEFIQMAQSIDPVTKKPEALRSILADENVDPVKRKAAAWVYASYLNNLKDKSAGSEFAEGLDYLLKTAKNAPISVADDSIRVVMSAAATVASRGTGEITRVQDEIDRMASDINNPDSSLPDRVTAYANDPSRSLPVIPTQSATGSKTPVATPTTRSSITGQKQSGAKAGGNTFTSGTASIVDQFWPGQSPVQIPTPMSTTNLPPLDFAVGAQTGSYITGPGANEAFSKSLLYVYAKSIGAPLPPITGLGEEILSIFRDSNGGYRFFDDAAKWNPGDGAAAKKALEDNDIEKFWEIVRKQVKNPLRTDLINSESARAKYQETYDKVLYGVTLHWGVGGGASMRVDAGGNFLGIPYVFFDGVDAGFSVMQRHTKAGELSFTPDPENPIANKVQIEDYTNYIRWLLQGSFLVKLPAISLYVEPAGQLYTGMPNSIDIKDAQTKDYTVNKKTRAGWSLRISDTASEAGNVDDPTNKFTDMSSSPVVPSLDVLLSGMSGQTPSATVYAKGRSKALLGGSTNAPKTEGEKMGTYDILFLEYGPYCTWKGGVPGDVVALGVLREYHNFSGNTGIMAGIQGGYNLSTGKADKISAELRYISGAAYIGLGANWVDKLGLTPSINVHIGF